MTRHMPPPRDGLWHVALNVADVARAKAFYVDVLGFRLEWEPDADNVYLTSGRDNLALHRAPPGTALEGPGRLDHVGIVVPEARDVDAWEAHLRQHGVAVERPTRTHRDGARSLYARDPEGVLIQILFHPPISSGARTP